MHTMRAYNILQYRTSTLFCVRTSDHSKNSSLLAIIQFNLLRTSACLLCAECYCIDDGQWCFQKRRDCIIDITAVLSPTHPHCVWIFFPFPPAMHGCVQCQRVYSFGLYNMWSITNLLHRYHLTYRLYFTFICLVEYHVSCWLNINAMTDHASLSILHFNATEDTILVDLYWFIRPDQ